MTVEEILETWKTSPYFEFVHAVMVKAEAHGMFRISVQLPKLAPYQIATVLADLQHRVDDAAPFIFKVQVELWH